MSSSLTSAVGESLIFMHRVNVRIRHEFFYQEYIVARKLGPIRRLGTLQRRRSSLQPVQIELRAARESLPQENRILSQNFYAR
jgi:hypothetical protein